MNKASWNKVLAMLLSIMLLVSMCAFAEPVVEGGEHEHEQETVVEETATEETEVVETETAEETSEEAAEETSEESTEETSEVTIEEAAEESNEETSEETAEETTEETTEETSEEATEEVTDGTTDEPAVEPAAEPAVMMLAAAPATEEVGDNYGISTLMLGDDLDINENCNGHIFRDEGASCVICGWVCDHSRSWSDYYIVDCVVDEDNTDNHISIWADYETCSFCGKILSVDEESKEYEKGSHNFNENGFCYQCGYENPGEKCTHANMTEDDFEFDVDYDWDKCTAIDANTHKAVKMKTGWGFCPDCGAEVTYYGEETESYVENHKFAMETPGLCWVCDYICQHPSTVQQNLYLPIIDGEWVEDGEYVNDTYHAVQYQLLLKKRCTLCDRDTEVETGTFITVNEWHSVDQEGYCEACDSQVGEDMSECDHTYAKTIDYWWADVEYIDGLTHRVYYEAFEVDSCTKCGANDPDGEERHVEEKDYSEVQKHNYSDGIDGAMRFGDCWDCGYTTKCTHPNMKTELCYYYWEKVEITAENHTGNSAEFECYSCPDCALYYECATGEKKTYTEEHYMEDGKCLVCGYTACTHANTESKSETLYYADPIDEATHQEYTVTTTSVICKDCGVAVGTPTEEKKLTEVVGHLWDANSVCSSCSYMCGHTKKTLGEAVTETVYTCDDSTHASTSRTTTPYTCDYCGITGTDILDTVGEPEKHTYAEGKCSVCEHICVHSNAVSETTRTLDSYYDLIDASHTADYILYTETTCPDCGNVEEDLAYETVTSAHTYLDSKCEDCGYVCEHSNPLSAEKFVPKSYEKKNSSKHIATGETYEVVTCADCEVKLSETLTAENVQVEEKHAFSSGKCSKCGYKKPVEEVVETPVVEETVEEPVFVEVAETEAVRGVTVTEAPAMVETMVQVVESIEAEATSLVIENVEKILNEEEHTQLTQLKASEQMLVLLQVMGFGEEVQTMLASSETALSENAALVGESIQARVSAMTEEELAAFQTLIAELFANMMGEQQEIVFTLTYVVGDKVTSEQYAFRQVDGAWVLTRIALAN